MRNRLYAAGALVLAGCDGTTPPGNVTSDPVAAGEYKKKIDALATRQRDAVMLRAVRDAGHDCQHVVGSAYQGLQFDMPSWVARCSDGRDWLVMLGQDGKAYVARREEKPREGS